VTDLAESLGLMLEGIRAGELSASAATSYRIEGALVALRTVLGTMEELEAELLRLEA
jgi:hypothetical protein